MVEPQLADNLMRLIAEGAGEEDEAADRELRSQAVSSYMALLEKPKLPDILLQVSTHKGLTSVACSSWERLTLQKSAIRGVADAGALIVATKTSKS